MKDGKRKSQSVFCKWVNDKPYIQREKSDIEIIQSRLMIFDSARLNNFRYPIFLVEYLLIIMQRYFYIKLFQFRVTMIG